MESAKFDAKDGQVVLLPFPAVSFGARKKKWNKNNDNDNDNDNKEIRLPIFFSPTAFRFVLLGVPQLHALFSLVFGRKNRRDIGERKKNGNDRWTVVAQTKTKTKINHDARRHDEMKKITNKQAKHGPDGAEQMSDRPISKKSTPSATNEKWKGQQVAVATQRKHGQKN